MEAKSLGSLLIHKGMINDRDWQTIAKACNSKPHEIIKGITALGIISEKDLVKVLAEKTRCKILEGNLLPHFDRDVLSLIDPLLMQRLEVVPLKETDLGHLVVAMANPLDRALLRQLEFFAGRKIKPILATPSQIEDCLEELVEGYEAPVSQLEHFIHQYIRKAGASGPKKHKNRGAKVPSATGETDSNNLTLTEDEKNLALASQDPDLEGLRALDGDDFQDHDAPLTPHATAEEDHENEIDLGDFDATAEETADLSMTVSAVEEENTALEDSPELLAEESTATDELTLNAPDLSDDINLLGEGSSESGPSLEEDINLLESEALSEDKELALSDFNGDADLLDEESTNQEELSVDLESEDELALLGEEEKEATELNTSSEIEDDLALLEETITSEELTLDIEAGSKVELLEEEMTPEEDLTLELPSLTLENDPGTLSEALDTLDSLQNHTSPDTLSEVSEEAEIITDDFEEEVSLATEETGIFLEPLKNIDPIEKLVALTADDSGDEDILDSNDFLADEEGSANTTFPLTPEDLIADLEARENQFSHSSEQDSQTLTRHVPGHLEKQLNTHQIGVLNRALLDLQLSSQHAEANQVCQDAMTMVFEHGLIYRVAEGGFELLLGWSDQNPLTSLEEDKKSLLFNLAPSLKDGWNSEAPLSKEDLPWSSSQELFVYKIHESSLGQIVWISETSHPERVTTGISTTCRQILKHYIGVLENLVS